MVIQLLTVLFEICVIKHHKENGENKYDKTANNVIIIWKRYNMDVLKGELNSTITYVPAQDEQPSLSQHL